MLFSFEGRNKMMWTHTITAPYHTYKNLWVTKYCRCDNHSNICTCPTGWKLFKCWTFPTRQLLETSSEREKEKGKEGCRMEREMRDVMKTRENNRKNQIKFKQNWLKLVCVGNVRTRTSHTISFSSSTLILLMPVQVCTLDVLRMKAVMTISHYYWDIIPVALGTLLFPQAAFLYC